MKEESRVCLHCGARGVKSRCGACKRVYFCDRECQKRVWAAHRPKCMAVAAAASAEPVPKDATPACTEAVETAAAHAKKTASPKTVTLVAEPVQVLELPAATCDHEDTTSSANAKKKKKKHGKKKKRSNSMHAPASAQMAPLKNRSLSLSVRKHIMWGDVTAREFARFPGGGGAVPYDGTWALGLGAPVADVQLGSVLDVEELRAQELKSRIQGLPKSKRSHVREGETRQFDYCRGIDNPLFSRLSERERKQVFMEIDAKNHPHNDEDEPQQHHSKRKSSISSSPPKHNHHSLRKLSMYSDGAGSENDDVVDTPDFACVSIEQLDEFAKIRDSREVACGCSCGDLVKKVAKMNVKRLHAFLLDRDIEVAVHTKPELMALAKAIAMKEKNCSNTKECECAKNGVECHSNVCDGCVGDCWNPFKSYMYNKKEVVQYRKEQLAKWKETNGLEESHSQSISVV
uniref:MYND-type domain-containing protein n=1 Tax=Globisporangium ultimum (strain ATCC 200006 / CBS 805.95 / DAOM BR144) TaxID=431595 RepID=K3WCD8_GLOUD